jgi:hypothetical protein
VFLLAAASIISNYTYFRNSAYFTRVDFLDAGRTFSGLVKGVCMDSATAISVSFYEQIDQANIVLSPRISKEFDLDTVRLAYINHLNSISVQSYLDSISLIQYKQLLINKDLIQTSDCQGDMIYLLGNPENGDRTYILYEYEDQNNDNLFVLPKNYLAKGLQ